MMIFIEQNIAAVIDPEQWTTVMESCARWWLTCIHFILNALVINSLKNIIHIWSSLGLSMRLRLHDILRVDKL